jgi:hypothetical protein
LDLPCSQCVLDMFASCSLEVPQVPKLFPNAISVAPQFYPIWFAQSSTLMYINSKGRLLGEFICFYFVTGGLKRCFHWGMLNVPKKLLLGQWIWLFQKKIKNYEPRRVMLLG